MAKGVLRIAGVMLRVVGSFAAGIKRSARNIRATQARGGSVMTAVAAAAAAVAAVTVAVGRIIGSVRRVRRVLLPVRPAARRRQLEHNAENEQRRRDR
jgi:hypothetical protein